MFERLSAFLQSLGGEENEEGEFGPDDPRLAAAALMYHLIEADGVHSPDEDARFAELLRENYGLDNETLKALVAAARDADSDAVDLYQFTSVLMRHLDLDGRLHFIELMWEIVYADGVNHELEDNLVWRVAELLGVDNRDRVLLRKAVRERTGAGDDGNEGEQDSAP